MVYYAHEDILRDLTRLLAATKSSAIDCSQAGQPISIGETYRSGSAPSQDGIVAAQVTTINGTVVLQKLNQALTVCLYFTDQTPLIGLTTIHRPSDLKRWVRAYIEPHLQAPAPGPGSIWPQIIITYGLVAGVIAVVVVFVAFFVLTRSWSG